jgi:N-acetylmuramoyl-L-alanine amidase
MTLLKPIISFLLLLTIIIGVNIVPAQAAAQEKGDNPQEQTAPPADVQQLENYIFDLDSYLKSLDALVSNKTLNAVKEISQYEISLNSPSSQSTTSTLADTTSTTPTAWGTPSRGGRSRATMIASSEDLDCLARTVYSEARGESFQGQVAVAAVVLNRLESGQYGNSVREVVFQRGAFTAVADGQYYMKPDAEAYDAARAALSGIDPTNGALYYWNPRTATSRWVWSRTIVNRIGNHVFAV